MGQVAIVIFFLGCIACVACAGWLTWMFVSQTIAELKDPGCFSLFPVGTSQHSRPIHPIGQTYQERQEWDGPRAEGKNWL